ncbi:MAG: hypothetical protein KF699_14905 [Phycisphaeraceae bacterium]|nr:hypothetical protein [Phycisphaeraceae bacterium]
MRNRAYMPQLGRFLQPDPNATALTLIEATSFHGRGMGGVGALVAAFSMLSLYEDGGNLYQYVRSNPWRRSDPLGLESGEDEEDGPNWFEEGMDAFALLDPLPGPSDFIREAAKAIVEDYAANLEWDVEWALDWDLPDDWHSRTDDTWVGLALARGAKNAFDIGLPGTQDSYNPLDRFAGQQKSGRGSRNGVGRNVNSGHSIVAQTGQRAHRNYRHTLGPGYRYEVTIPGAGRADAINVNAKIVRELKPDTPTGRASGAKRLAKYVAGLARHPDPSIRGTYAPYLDTYGP